MSIVLTKNKIELIKMKAIKEFDDESFLIQYFDDGSLYIEDKAMKVNLDIPKYYIDKIKEMIK